MYRGLPYERDPSIVAGMNEPTSTTATESTTPRLLAGVNPALLKGMDGPGRARAVAGRQEGVIAAWQCRQLGLGPDEVRALCRSGRWQRLYRGTYLVDADIAGDPGHGALTRAGLLTAGPKAVAVLGSAAAIHGIQGVPGRDSRVHVSLPGNQARPRRTVDAGLTLHQLRIASHEVTMVDGAAVTTPLRTVADLVLQLDRYSAVSVMDSALNLGLITDTELATLPELIAGRRGAVRARLWVPEADARAASPLETRVRLCCVDDRVPPDTLQHPVYDRHGELLGIADLAWLGARVLGEADGQSVHEHPDALFRDRWRQNDLANAGWVVIRFTWADTLRPGYIGYVVRQALGRALAA